MYRPINAGLSQGDVAKVLGYSSAQFVSNWERGLKFRGKDSNLYSFVGNDPVNRVDPVGTGPILGGVCAFVSGYQFTSKFIENADIKKQLNGLHDVIERSKIGIDKELSKDCPNYDLVQKLSDALATDTARAAKLTLELGQTTADLIDLIERASICGVAALVPTL